MDIEATPALREIKPVPLNDLVVAESRRVQHFHVLAPGARLEDLLVPDIWSLAAPKLHRNDLIEVVPVDGSWWAMLLVLKTGPEYAEVAILHRIDLPAAPLTVDDLPLGHSVFFLGPRRLWAALRGEQILRHGFSTKDAAIAWIIEALRS